MVQHPSLSTQSLDECMWTRVTVIFSNAINELLGLHTISVRALWNGQHVCRLSLCVRSRKLSDIGMKFRHLYCKLGSLSKNMTSDFAPEVAKYSKSTPKPQNFGRVWAYCFTPLAMQLVLEFPSLLWHRWLGNKSAVLQKTYSSPKTSVFSYLAQLRELPMWKPVKQILKVIVVTSA